MAYSVDGGDEVGWGKDLLTLMRPKQYYKNLIIFIGIIFSLKVGEVSLWPSLILGFISLCLVSSSSYIVNDIMDREKDRAHPRKRERPIASGRVSVKTALSLGIVLAAAGLVLAFVLDHSFFVMVVLFTLLMEAYNLVLKRIALVDVLTIASDFVLRAVAGCVLINVTISPWLIICTFLAALLLALGKRRHEMTTLGDKVGEHRDILSDANFLMLDVMVTVVTSALLVSYMLYTFLSVHSNLLLTIPPVVYGLFRYVMIVHNDGYNGEAELLFKDRGMIAVLVLWLLVSMLAIYGVLSSWIDFIMGW